MNPDLTNLLQLDKVNQEIAKLQAEIAGLPQTLAAIEVQLATSKGQVEQAKASIHKEEAAKRALESDIKDWQQKIVKFREQSASVKTNDQYRALMHEIEFAEKQISDCETKILEGLERAETLQKQLKQAEAELKAHTAEVEEEKAHARCVTAEDEKRLGQLRAEQAKLRPGISPSTLTIYDRVSKKRASALAEAYEQKCTSCHVMLRPQTYNELLKGDSVITCESCARILYVDPNHAPAQQAVNKSTFSEKAWYYLPDFEGQSRFGLFSNSKTGCSLRLFDVQNGMASGAIKKKGVFREVFADALAHATLLHLTHAQVDHSDVDGERLSPDTLEEMQIQSQVAPNTATALQ
jgi:uncharacterized protein